MAAMLQLVVVDDRDKRMQLERTDVACVVVDRVNFQYFLHKPAILRKGKQNNRDSVKMVDLSVNALFNVCENRRTFASSTLSNDKKITWHILRCPC